MILCFILSGKRNQLFWQQSHTYKFWRETVGCRQGTQLSFMSGLSSSSSSSMVICLPQTIQFQKYQPQRQPPKSILFWCPVRVCRKAWATPSLRQKIIICKRWWMYTCTLWRCDSNVLNFIPFSIIELNDTEIDCFLDRWLLLCHCSY